MQEAEKSQGQRFHRKNKGSFVCLVISIYEARNEAPEGCRYKGYGLPVEGTS
jgi:hypothetical protein